MTIRDAVPSPTGRPPAEHRFAGLDRRTLVPGVLVLVWAALCLLVLPGIDRAVSYDDPIRAGDALRIGPSATMAPPVGWELEDGIRTSDRPRAFSGNGATSRITDSTVVVQTQAGKWPRSARALVDQVLADDQRVAGALEVDGPHRSLPLRGGRVAVVREFRGPARAGAVFAVVDRGVGIQMTIVGAETDLDRRARDLGTMLASISFDGDRG